MTMTAPTPNCTEGTYNVMSKLSFAALLRDRHTGRFLSSSCLTPLPLENRSGQSPLLSCSLGAVVTPTLPARGMCTDCTIQNIVLGVQ